VNLKQDRIEHWLKMGAQPSPTVARLIKLSKKQPGQPASQPGQSTLR
jgi:ribosomal protein S16